jgi:hypothetical protein
VGFELERLAQYRLELEDSRVAAQRPFAADRTVGDLDLPGPAERRPAELRSMGIGVAGKPFVPGPGHASVALAVSPPVGLGEIIMRPGAHDMPIPFSKQASNDPVLRALEEGQPLGTTKAVVLAEMPSISQFARISARHGVEFALTQDALYGRPHIIQGSVNQVGVPSLHLLLAHGHLDERFVQGAWWFPSQGDLELIRRLHNRSSVIVSTADGRADTFYDARVGKR